MYRRTFLKLSGFGLLAGLTGCDAMGSVFGRMFAVPPRETTYFTPNAKFYVVNYSNSPFSLSHNLNQEQWRVHITGEVKHKASLGWRDILNRESYDQVVTLECIDTLPGGDSLQVFDTDGNFSWERFEERYEADLANALGNLASRSIAMVERYRGGVLVLPEDDKIFHRPTVVGMPGHVMA